MENSIKQGLVDNPKALVAEMLQRLRCKSREAAWLPDMRPVCKIDFGKAIEHPECNEMFLVGQNVLAIFGCVDSSGPED